MRYATRAALAPYAAALAKSMRGQVETVRVLYLDAAGRIIRADDITLSGATETAAGIDTRHFVRAMVDTDAAAVVIAHNHPHGPLATSPEDDAMARAAGKVCAWLGVSVKGNLLFSGGQWIDIRHKKSEKILDKRRKLT